MKKRLKEGLFLVRQKDSRGGEYDFVIWVEESYSGRYKVQVRYGGVHDGFGIGALTFNEKAEEIRKGYRPSSGNALPLEFNLIDAKKVASSIANSTLYRS